MNTVVNSIRNFIRSEDGPTTAEYGVLVALIIVAVAGAISVFGTKLSDLFTGVGDAMDNAAGQADTATTTTP